MAISKDRLFKLLLALGTLWISLIPTYVFSLAPFYQGKTLTIVQGREPGALGYNRVRDLIPFLRKYIPGNSTIVSEFMPGGRGRKATNNIYSSVRPDGLTIGAQSVGHDIYINPRMFAWILALREARFVPGYGGSELDLALLQGEVDARAQTAAWLAHRNPDWLGKRLVDVHAGIEIPKGEQHPRFTQLPELESFARSDKEQQILAMLRAFRLAGSPYVLPPGTPKERVEILQEAIRKGFKDAEFHKEFKKLTGDVPTPLMPETMEKYIRDIPRSPEIVALFHKIAGAEPLPVR